MFTFQILCSTNSPNEFKGRYSGHKLCQEFDYTVISYTPEYITCPVPHGSKRLSYDIQTKTHHNFIVDGYIIHNSILKIYPDGRVSMTSRARSVKDFMYVPHETNVLGFNALKSPFKGIVVLDGELMSPTDKIDTGATITASPLQACLVGNTRILTSRGLIKIEDLYKMDVSGMHVHTGKKMGTIHCIGYGKEEYL